MVLFTILTTGAEHVWFDFPSLLIVIIFPFILMYILNGNNALKMAFSAPFKKSKSKLTLLKAIEYFNNYNKITWLFAFIAVIIGFMAILVNPEDKSSFGPNMAVNLIVIMYAALVNVFIIIPFKILINKKIREFE
jgi:FtsH-binding integral membrane protein